MKSAAVHLVDGEPTASHDATDELARGLAIAARAEGWSFIALPAPVTDASALIDALRDQPRVAWTAGGLTLVGLGAARELRGTGDARWEELVRGARLGATGAIIDGASRDLAALGVARPRFVGGAAFAPGAADRAPWLGFGDAWFMLPRWTYVHDGRRGHIVLAVDARDAGRDVWRDELARLNAALAARIAQGQPALLELQRASAEQWRDQIVAITDAIDAGACSKIVAARTCSVALAGAVRAADLLAALDQRHAECMRVLIQPPGAGALVAATPERLVRRDGDQVWCDALAGTLSLPGDHLATAEAGEALLASTKDRREHELVVQAIRAALEGDAEVDAPAVPEVRVLRHLVHLHTPFHAVLHTPRHLLEIVARLHPTPAVGGTPRAFAIEWIRSREPVARGWYASPVGWFDLEGNGELAVALRSGVIAGNRAHLWAGAGIVAGSDPDRELAETDLKFRAMLGALGVEQGA